MAKKTCKYSVHARYMRRGGSYWKHDLLGTTSTLRQARDVIRAQPRTHAGQVVDFQITSACTGGKRRNPKQVWRCSIDGYNKLKCFRYSGPSGRDFDHDKRLWRTKSYRGRGKR